MVDGSVFSFSCDVPKTVVERAVPTGHGEDMPRGGAEFRFQAFSVERVFTDGEVSEMLEIDHPHRRVASIAYGANALQPFIGVDVQDVILGGIRVSRHRTPNVAVAESFAL